MQVEGKSIESVMQEFEDGFGMEHPARSFVDSDDYLMVEDFLRSSIASVLLHVKSKMPEKAVKSGFSDCAVHAMTIQDHKDITRNRTIMECHAVLDEQIQEAKKLSE